MLFAHQTVAITYSLRNRLMHADVLMSFLRQKISINFHVEHLLFVLQHAKCRLIIIADAEYLSLFRSVYSAEICNYTPIP